MFTKQVYLTLQINFHCFENLETSRILIMPALEWTPEGVIPSDLSPIKENYLKCNQNLFMSRKGKIHYPFKWIQLNGNVKIG